MAKARTGPVRAAGGRRLSAGEISAAICVIVGLLFVVVRVLNMGLPDEPAPPITNEMEQR